MLRGLIAVGLSVAIPVAALCAPLVHAHLDSHDSDHHSAPLVHSHFSGHADAARSVDETHVEGHDGERTVWLQVFVAVAGSSFDLPVVSPTFVHLPVPLESAAHRPVDVSHAHDPPLPHPRPSRAPPSFLA